MNNKGKITELTWETEDRKYVPYIFKRKGTEGQAGLACCMDCELYFRCETRMKLAEIVLDAIDRIVEETNTTYVGELTLYAKRPGCAVPRHIEEEDDDG